MKFGLNPDAMPTKPVKVEQCVSEALEALEENRSIILVGTGRRDRVIFAQHLAWIENQFRALGQGNEASGLASRLLSALQSASILAHAFHGTALAAVETDRFKNWIQNL